MIEIRISNKLKSLCPDVAIGSIQGHVGVIGSSKALTREMAVVCNGIADQYQVSDIAKINNIKDSRSIYKKLGHDPTRYRLASEALVRRTVKGQKVYPINNIVDISNLVSLKTFYPVCTYDLDKISSPVTFTIGGEEDSYQAIGRGSMKLANLPVFADLQGKFGSTTSDSERTKVTKATKNITLNIVSFNGPSQLLKGLQLVEDLLRQYGEGKDLDKRIIE